MKFEKTLGRIFLMLIFTVFALVFLDWLSIKIIGKSRSPIEKKFNVQSARQPKPYVMFGGASRGKIWSGQFNRLGYVDNVPSKKKDEDEFRIIVVGGSTIVMGAPPLPRLLEYKLKERGCSNARVYNFGVISSVTGMELARILFETVDYNPDLIISYSGFNDIDQPFVADPRPGYPFNFIAYENNPLLESDVEEYPLLPLVLYKSNLLRHFYPQYFLNEFVPLKSERGLAAYRTDAWQEKIADQYLNNIAKSSKVANAFGAQFIAFFQPSLYTKSLISDRERKFLDVDRAKSARTIHTLIKEKAHAANVSFYDLSDVFRSTAETVFSDRVHVHQIHKPQIVDAMLNSLIKSREIALPCTF